jgi:dienelactone hydrolase
MGLNFSGKGDFMLRSRIERTIAMVVMLAAAGSVSAAMRAQTVGYEHGDVALEGYLVYDDAVEGKRPGVLVIHEWWGLNEYIKRRARQLAERGYVVFAVDMYGGGQVTEDANEAGMWAGRFRNDRTLLRARAAAGLGVLLKQEQVDAEKVAAIGYCFGGTTAMELAYSGADLAGVVSLHGTLKPPSEEDLNRIRASILICHGSDDAMMSDQELHNVTNALERAGVDWLKIIYGHAKHAFSNPAADVAGIEGVGYNERAARRSMQHMLLFLKEVLGRGSERE